MDFGNIPSGAPKTVPKCLFWQNYSVIRPTKNYLGDLGSFYAQWSSQSSQNSEKNQNLTLISKSQYIKVILSLKTKKRTPILIQIIKFGHVKDPWLKISSPNFP